MFASKSAPRAATNWICSSCRQSQRKGTAGQRRHTRSVVSAANLKDSQKLPSTPARTRFAPSPTGYLHLGSLRTALFNYLIAKATKGQFLLRIEDTDTKRTVPGAEDRICSDLAWAGLQWDEGPQVGGPYGPYRQSERTELYKQHAEKLLDNGHAYRCFCTAERLNELAEARAKMGLPTDYDRTCASISKEESDDRAHKGEQHTIRLKAPEVYPEYHDVVYGRVGKKQKPGSTRKHGETVYEDPILMKSDGLPTYHLANVVDDHLMKITHVVRAAEWMPSTPKHLALYQAFGWDPPAFAHVGLLQDNKGQKLSKRNADIDLDSYRQRDIFPEALANFCALLGWSHTRGDDFMTPKDLIDNFSLKFTKGNTVVTFKKLDYLQKNHGRRYVTEKGPVYEQILSNICALLKARQEQDSNWNSVAEGRASRLVASLLDAENDKNGFYSAEKFLDQYRSFFVSEINRGETPTLDWRGSGAAQRGSLFVQLSELSSEQWNSERIHDAVANVAKDAKVSSANLTYDQNVTLLLKYLRWAIFSQPGPAVAVSMAMLGKDTSLARLNEANIHMGAS